MIVQFRNEHLEALYKGESKGKPKFSPDVIVKFKKTVSILKNVKSSAALKLYRSLNFERLKISKNSKYYSVRVDIQYRLIFELHDDKIQLTEILTIEKLTNHYQ